MKRAGLIAILVLLSVSMTHAGWRPEVRVQTDAEWLTRLDARLAPVRGGIRDTLDIVATTTTSPDELDAYVVIIQQQARRGIGILDNMEPAPRCAVDYMAVERTMLLMWGDMADAWVQVDAGSSQASVDLAALVPAARYMLLTYGDRLRLSTVCEPPEPVVTPTASPAPARTTTPTVPTTP